MTKEVEAALKVLDEVCAKFQGTRQDHLILTSSLQVIVTALGSKAEPKKIKVPKKALPRDKKRKGKGKK